MRVDSARYLMEAASAFLLGSRRLARDLGLELVRIKDSGVLVVSLRGARLVVVCPEARRRWYNLTIDSSSPSLVMAQILNAANQVADVLVQLGDGLVLLLYVAGGSLHCIVLRINAIELVG